MKNKKFRFQWGAFLLLAIYGGLFLLLFLRIASIQLTGEVEGKVLAAKAAAMYQQESAITANRGKILDAKGNVIAEDTLSYRLVAVISKDATQDPKKPRHVVNMEKTARILAKYIPMEEQQIYERLTKGKDLSRYQVEFGSAGRGISHQIMTEVTKANLPGILFVRDLKRYYPNGVFASHLIGFAVKEEFDNGKRIETNGKMGLEQYYDDQLTGKDGKVEYKSDLFGYLLPNSKKMITPAKDGYNIHLTLDKTIQNFLEDAMNRAEQQYTPESIMAVVANPKTGEILAMSQRPTFDPDTRDTKNMKWLNQVIEETIEPGSTMKTFTLASAVDTGKWAPNASYQSGQYTVFDRTIRDHNQVGWGTITYLEGFQRSSNTAMAHLLEQIGDDTFIEYLKKFGFGRKTGIDLPNEASGTILSKYPIQRVTTTYGQGSTVTPIQLVQAMTAIANDGKMMQPYVIDKIVDPNTGKVIENHKPVVAGHPVTAETAKYVREVLASTVTSEKGTATNFKLDEYEVAGKTGTAQIPKENGSYYWGKNEFLYSFLGMAPVDNPQLIVYVAVKKPDLSATETGSMPVSEIFKDVTAKSLKYLNINPENVESAKMIKVDDYTNDDANNVQIALTNKGLEPIIIGEGGKVIDQYPKAKVNVTNGQIVFLKTAGVSKLPAFNNWSLRNVLIYKSMSGLPIEIVGEGYVESQSVSPGVTISDQAPIVVKLQTPEEQFIPKIDGNNEENAPSSEKMPQD